ncbi:MAG: fimbrillin family protein [Bacteroidales bacterium]|nr:fimbrillin family protein [Bacteroidales bacterium]
MIIKKHIYIVLALCTVVLSGCSSDVAVPDTLSGDGTKTPLTVTALLDASGKAAKTRAVDKTFETSDQLLAYIRHVKWDGTTADARTSVPADKAPRLVTFTKGSTDMTAYSGVDITPIGTGVHLGLTSENTQQTSDLTNDLGVGGGHIYWDDFSNASSEETDLHTDGHYLQSYYGYCYNGGTPTEDLEQGDNKINGVIKWAVQTNQTTGIKTSDLLWSAEQTPVAYNHASNREDGTRAGLVLPYTHAMSKVTINVIAGEGFESTYNFTNTGVKLDNVRVKCTATAPTATLTYPGKDVTTAKDDVIMQKGTLGTTAERPSHTFQAIIVPSVLTVGNKLASITGMDGNEYFVYVTDNIINDWRSQLTDTDEDIHSGTAQVRPQTRANEAEIPAGTGHEMKSGVHYILNVTVNKTEVTVSATILDWNEITAEGEGEIFFEHDIKDDGTINNALKDHGFDVYKSTTTTFGAKATSLRWNRTTEKWKYNPAIYWQGGQNEYFRALANVRADAAGTPANESLAMENGRDALWGTTPAHSGEYDDDTPYSYIEGAALAPRTGKVPLLFYHAMAKITINLKDISAGVTGADPASLLDLHGATIQLTNLATGGTIELDKGVITPSAKEDKTFSEDRGAIPSRMGFFAASENGTPTTYNSNVTVREYFITPQNIGNDALLIVTLANGTTYKAQLNLCQTQNSHTAVNKWERNTHYIYDITLAKDQILFRAEIKDWDEVKVSGIITPEW